ncbi:MAG: carboxypeptidase-like regulatory domain-containing protein [Saprospiraceae bacterium]|nr:carboxypeptidase-like regulatory domain-containing protein [Saprospiraceae bacterium]
MRLVLICLTLAFTGIMQAFSQSGTIEGIILDADTKESQIGAYVLIDGTSEGTTTDIDGLFVLRVAPGTYTIAISSLGYETIKIENVVVEQGKKTELNAALKTESLVLAEVMITDYKKTNTDVAVLLEIKQAKQVVSAISSQQIQKSQDSNAAQVMQRIPGVTIVENRFVMIRGLSERYNNVMINNVIAPSTEVDKRTFSFDLVSSNALDKMLIYKSGSADMPGDFAGGVIKLFTVDNVDENFTKLSLGLGMRPGTTFSPYFQSQGSSTDWLGFDNGYRGLPSTFPTTSALAGSARNADIRKAAAHSLPNNFVAQESMATLDYSVGLSFGRNIDLGNGKKLSTINSISYSNSYQYYVRDFHRYFEWVDQSQPILQRFVFNDDTYQKENKITVLSNWNYRINANNRIKFKNLFNQIGENETVLRNGFDFIQRPDDNLRNYLLGYRSRSIYTGQLEGEHNLSEKNNLRWVFGGSYLNESEPDLRRFRTYRAQNAPENLNYTMQLPPSSNLFETGRYFGSLNEFSVNHGVDYTYKLGEESAKQITLKTGYYADYRDRDFSSRYISYLYPGFFNPEIGRELSMNSLDKIFSNENIKTTDGLVIEEGTRPIDSYQASNLLFSGYFSTEIPFNEFNFIGGVRVENNTQTMTSRNDFEVIEVKNPVTSFMPFGNLSYNLTSKSILRAAYGRTVNRPEFRELAPFLFYDYKLEAGRVGNPNLVTATIDNLDLRYEFYPRSGEIISIGGFYKYFNDPIENRTIITTEQPQFTFINAEFARNYGAELEIRKSLKGVTGSSFIDNFSVNMNASIIFSEVDLGSSAVAQKRERALQGQSPYIVNTALYYANQSNLNINLIYNVFGARIFSVGDDLFPTIYELPRNSFDISISKQVGKRVTYKLGVQDLLNARYRFFQDSDRNEKIDDKDNVIFSFRRGSLFSLSATYNLF